MMRLYAVESNRQPPKNWGEAHWPRVMVANCSQAARSDASQRSARVAGGVAPTLVAMAASVKARGTRRVRMIVWGVGWGSALAHMVTASQPDGQ